MSQSYGKKNTCLRLHTHIGSNLMNKMLNQKHFSAGPYTYYVIPLEGVWGVKAHLMTMIIITHQNDCILHEHFCITDFQSFKQEILIEWAAFGI